jgi:broad specificity phosphatase PhoE
MFKKRIYLVRHGETILNAAKIRQGEDGGLSELGKLQSIGIGERLKNFDINMIFCSPFQRAIETAEEISKVLKDLPIEYVPMLGERKNPTKIIGLGYDDPTTTEAINFMDKSFHTADARWDDEENFNDLKERALKLKVFLEKNSTRSTLCVSHGIFLKMFLSILIRGKDLSVEEYIKLSLFNPADNAGITVIEYTPLKFFSNPWEIVAYNDSPVSITSD